MSRFCKFVGEAQPGQRVLGPSSQFRTPEPVAVWPRSPTLGVVQPLRVDVQRATAVAIGRRSLWQEVLILETIRSEPRLLCAGQIMRFSKTVNAFYVLPSVEVPHNCTQVILVPGHDEVPPIIGDGPIDPGYFATLELETWELDEQPDPSYVPVVDTDLLYVLDELPLLAEGSAGRPDQLVLLFPLQRVERVQVRFKSSSALETLDVSIGLPIADDGLAPTDLRVAEGDGSESAAVSTGKTAGILYEDAVPGWCEAIGGGNGGAVTMKRGAEIAITRRAVGR